MTARVAVVGAGVAGIACARKLAAADVEVQVFDRGHRGGGRMAVRHVDGRPIDVGAAYLTVREPDFAAVVEDWCARGLAQPWTNSFDVYDRGGWSGVDAGPVRYAAGAGLRSLVEDLAGGLTVFQRHDVCAVGPGPRVDGTAFDAVVLAMPDPQALDILASSQRAEIAACQDRDWRPVLTLYAGWRQRCWEDFHGAFVNDHPVLAFVADDGARRGDAAPVLVAHSTGGFAAPRLDDPAAGIAPLVSALAELLGLPEPEWAQVKRWSLARPARPRELDAPYHLGPDRIGLCGDGWGSPRVETAFLSGHALGQVLASQLA